MNTIVIDCGASFIKGALFQDEVITKQKQMQAPKGKQKEDIYTIVQMSNLVSLVKNMILDLGAGQEEVTLCISNEMHGFLLGYEDGTCYTDYISWQNEYGSFVIDGISSIELLRKDALKKDIRHTGMPLRAGLPSCNLSYLSRKGYLKEAKSPLYFYTLGDYILRALSDQQPICHITNAAATGLFDIENEEWNHNLIEAVGGGALVFPKVGFGCMSFMLDKLHVTAWPAVGDQQAALFGAGLDRADQISYNLGTGAQVSRLTSRLEFSDHYQLRPYFGNTYLVTLPHIPSGRALNVYFGFFKDVLHEAKKDMDDESLWDILIDTANRQTNFNMRCDMSFFENSITDHLTGSIENIEEYSFTLSNVMGTIFAQMGDNFVHASDIICENCDKEISEVIFSGGIARKIELIRENVLKKYDETMNVKVAVNETLEGLHRYAKLCVGS